MHRILMVVLFLLFLLSKQPATCQQNIPTFIRTIGKLPQLAYSTGEDRLGSTKMGYIDTNIVLKVIDTTKNLYKVKLSATRHAFIEKLYTEPLPDTVAVPGGHFLSGSWSVKGNDTTRTDLVSISLSGIAAYKTW